MLSLNQIYNIDALEGLKQLDNESVDVFIFSPPYNLRMQNGKVINLSNGGKWKNYKLSTGYENHNDAMPHEDYIKWQKSILSECWRCTKKTGAIFYNHKPLIRKGIAILPLEYNPNLPIRQIIIWKRAGGFNFNCRFYLPTHEWIILFAKPDFKLKSTAASGIKDVWEFPQQRGSKHPASFPINLPDNILETVKYKDLVCDPFIGSGTVALSAKKFGSNYIGFDSSLEYCKMSEERLKNVIN
jgi:modification methylase